MGFSDQINDLLVYGCITDIKVARKIIQYPYESCERGDQKCKWVTLDGCAWCRWGRDGPPQSGENNSGPAPVRVLLLLQHLQAPYLPLSPSCLPVLWAGRSHYGALNILPISSHWIFDNDLEKLLNSWEPGRALNVSTGRGPHRSSPNNIAREGGLCRWRNKAFSYLPSLMFPGWLTFPSLSCKGSCGHTERLTGAPERCPASQCLQRILKTLLCVLGALICIFFI